MTSPLGEYNQSHITPMDPIARTKLLVILVDIMAKIIVVESSNYRSMHIGAPSSEQPTIAQPLVRHMPSVTSTCY